MLNLLVFGSQVMPGDWKMKDKIRKFLHGNICLLSSSSINWSISQIFLQPDLLLIIHCSLLSGLSASLYLLRCLFFIFAFCYSFENTSGVVIVADRTDGTAFPVILFHLAVKERDRASERDDKEQKTPASNYCFPLKSHHIMLSQVCFSCTSSNPWPYLQTAM